MKLLLKVLLVLIVVAVVWAKWTGYFVQKLEVTDYSCGVSGGQLEFILTVENIWDEPLSLTARGIFITGDGRKANESPIHPDPLLPEQTGQFTLRAQAPPSVFVGVQFKCWIQWIRDESGRKVKIIQPDSVILTL